MIPQILILASELIEKPPPVGWFVETSGTLQLAEPPRDELRWVEGHWVTRNALSQTGVMQHGNGRWIETEEVQPPAIWPITFEAIEEGTMTIVQLIYNVAFQGQNNLGIAAALSVIVLLALIAINIFQLRAFRRPDES